MSDSKTYVFGEGAGNGLDGTALAMMNGGMGGGMWNNPIWAIVFLAAMRNGGIFGDNDGRGNADAAFVSSQLGQAIAGNANAVSNLSTHLDCSIGQVQTGLSALQSAICNLGNQNGMSAMQIVNAVNSGDAALTSALQSCCCEIKQGISGVNIGITQGFGNLRYENAANTCAVKQAIADQTQTVLAKLDAMEDSRKDREIASLTAALTAANSRAERQAELAPIYKSLADIECKQPATVTTAYSPFVAVPNCVAAQMGLYGVAGAAWPNGSGVFG